MLGYAGGLGVSGSYFGSAGTTFGMDDVICTGSETSILACFYQTTDDCGARKAAGVICQEDVPATAAPQTEAGDNKGI